MNILYCGDKNIQEGLLLSVLSLRRTVQEALHVYVLTMHYQEGEKTYFPVTDQAIAFLDMQVKAENRDSFVQKLDITDLFIADTPEANLSTRFTAGCMLRLYADLVPELPDRVLYLDYDVICRRDCTAFYAQDLTYPAKKSGAGQESLEYELAGVLDYYGRFFFRNRPLHMDYLNSGVLLLNLKEIRKTGLFDKCRARCREKEMFMPDQSAINKLCVRKKICPRRFNEQRILRDDTVLQHFTTSFRFFPWFHILCVKPWQVEQVHEKLKLHEYDDLLQEFLQLKPQLF
ncbi:MAG: hypothetical protein LUE22_08465 [Oscillospiraceae bacterium]|nr:hypothetical protein [Oscillospiraceae bacterium]